MSNKISFTIKRKLSWGFNVVYKGNLSNGRPLDHFMLSVIGKKNYNKILNCKKYKVTYEKRWNGIYTFDGASIRRYDKEQDKNFAFCNCLIPNSWSNCNIKRYVTVLE